MIEKIYYKNSGAFGIMAPIYILLAGVLSSAILGAIYAYAVFWIPFIYLNFILTFGLGFVVGGITGAAGKKGRVRNKGFMRASGIVMGLLTVYVIWVVWIYALSEHEILVFSPLDLATLIDAISDRGVWSMFGYTPTGAVLYIIWAIEAGIILWLTTAIAGGFADGTPFCERCGKWAEEEFEISPLSRPLNPKQVVEQMERGDLSGLTALNREPDKSRYSSIVLQSCPSCDESQFLTLKVGSIVVDDEGKAAVTEEVLAENLILTDGQHSQLKEHWLPTDPAVPSQESNS